MALSKKAARLLREAHDLFGETHDYRQGDSVTSADHKSHLKAGIAHLKSVFIPEIGDEPSRGAMSGGPQGDSRPLAVPPVGSTFADQSKSPRRLTKGEQEHCQAALNVAESLARHADMHRAGRSMLKDAAGHVRTVLLAHAGDKGVSADDLAARLIGALAGGKSVSPGVLATLGEVVGQRWEQLPDEMIAQALADD
jgi:hypothetical protein